jgi:hypothetical protein
MIKKSLIATGKRMPLSNSDPFTFPGIEQFQAQIVFRHYGAGCVVIELLNADVKCIGFCAKAFNVLR